jgi:GNAT superfamily N-acetyltransferase
MEATQEPDLPSLTPPAPVGAGALPAGYPPDLEREVWCPDGFSYHVRPIRPDDGHRLVAFHRRLSPHSVYLRFFTFHPTLSSSEVHRFTTVDYVDRLALVAMIRDEMIAVGRFDRAPGDGEAEVAFVVTDEYQHHGVGSLLLDELARAARARGIESFKAETLAENATMLDVFRHAGYPVTTTVEYGTVTVRFPLELTDAARRALEAREASRRPPARGDT